MIEMPNTDRETKLTVQSCLDLPTRRFWSRFHHLFKQRPGCSTQLCRVAVPAILESRLLLGAPSRKPAIGSGATDAKPHSGCGLFPGHSLFHQNCKALLRLTLVFFL